MSALAPHRTDQGWHLVEPGEHFIYRGIDPSMWGEPCTVLSLCGIDYRCRIQLERGPVVPMVNEHGLSLEGGALR